MAPVHKYMCHIGARCTTVKWKATVKCCPTTWYICIYIYIQICINIYAQVYVYTHNIATFLHSAPPTRRIWMLRPVPFRFWNNQAILLRSQPVLTISSWAQFTPKNPKPPLLKIPFIPHRLTPPKSPNSRLTPRVTTLNCTPRPPLSESRLKTPIRLPTPNL